jgi:D-apionolactonase
LVLVAGDAVRDVRVHGHRVLDAIVVAVRDDVWGTYPATVTSRDGSLHGTHGDVFSWTGRLEVSADTVHFGLRGRVLRDFDSQRVGICLLHPLELAGRDFRTDVGPGTFGVAVDPSVLATGFRSLSYDVGCPVDITLDGPPFEMEDHRNWSDPGWKSYCPPLSGVAPRRWRADEEVVQAVTVRGRPSVVPAVGRYGTDMKDVVEGGSTVDPPRGEPLSVTLVGRTRSWLTDAAARLARRGDLVRVAVFDPSTHTTAPGSVPLVRAVLRDLGCDAPVGGGSRAHLAELNRLDADPGEWDFCTFPVTAQAHHSDTASVLATARAQPAMMAQVRRTAPGLPIVVGPLAFRRRQGANAPAAPHDPADPRESDPLCAAWLLGCVLALRGAEALSVLLKPAAATDRVLWALDALAGRPFVDLPTGRPNVLAATVLGAVPVTLVANLGTEPVTVRSRSVAGYGVAFIEGET